MSLLEEWHYKPKRRVMKRTCKGYMGLVKSWDCLTGGVEQSKWELEVVQRMCLRDVKTKSMLQNVNINSSFVNINNIEYCYWIWWIQSKTLNLRRWWITQRKIPIRPWVLNKRSGLEINIQESSPKEWEMAYTWERRGEETVLSNVLHHTRSLGRNFLEHSTTLCIKW